MNPKHSFYDTCFVWGSFFAFLLFYLLQKGNGLFGIEVPFPMMGAERNHQYYCSLGMNVIWFAIIMVGFAAIYLTKDDKRIFAALRCGWVAYLVIVGTLILGVIKATQISPAPLWEKYLPEGHGLLALSIILAVLSVPCLLFIVAWSREHVSTKCTERLNSVLHGRRFLMGCAVFAFLCLGYEIYCAFGLNIWKDESCTLVFLINSYEKIIESSAADLHPPLYYVIAKFVIGIITACMPSFHVVYAAKIVSVLPLVVLYVICMTIVRKMFGNYVAALGCIALVCMPGIMPLSIEIRMYTWCMLWVTCCWLSTYTIYAKNRIGDWAWLVLFSLLTAYTHYGSCIAVALPWFFLCIWSWKRRCVLRWCMAALIVIAGFMPWLIILVQQFETMGRGSWMAPMSWGVVCNLILFTTKDLLVFLLVGITFIVAWSQRHEKSCQMALVGMGMVMFMIVVMSTISYMYAPVIAAKGRYVVPMLGAFWLGVLLVADTAGKQKLKLLLPIIIGMVAVKELHSHAHTQHKGRKIAAQVRAFVEEQKASAIIQAVGDNSSGGGVSISMETGAPLFFLDNTLPKYMDIYLGEKVITAHRLKQMVKTEGPALLVLSWWRENQLSNTETILNPEGLKLTKLATFPINEKKSPYMLFYRISAE